MVPYNRPHVMEGVVVILLTARRLLDAGERRMVGEHVLAVPTNWPLKGASRCGAAGESIIKNLESRSGSRYVAMEYFGLKRMSVQCVSLHRTRNVRKKRTIEI